VQTLDVAYCLETRESIARRAFDFIRLMPLRRIWSLWHKADMVQRLSHVSYWEANRHSAKQSQCSLFDGGFNRSAQHLLILRGEEVCHDDVADLVHGSAESRAVGPMEERAKCCGYLAGAGKEEQDRR
jgi:hypothetical protein